MVTLCRLGGPGVVAWFCNSRLRRAHKLNTSLDGRASSSLASIDLASLRCCTAILARTVKLTLLWGLWTHCRDRRWKSNLGRRGKEVGSRRPPTFSVPFSLVNHALNHTGTPTPALYFFFDTSNHRWVSKVDHLFAGPSPRAGSNPGASSSNRLAETRVHRVF